MIDSVDYCRIVHLPLPMIDSVDYCRIVHLLLPHKVEPMIDFVDYCRIVHLPLPHKVEQSPRPMIDSVDMRTLLCIDANNRILAKEHHHSAHDKCNTAIEENH